MPRAAKICSHPHCPNFQPCPDHQRKAWSKTNPRSERTLSGSRQQKRSRYILEKYGLICHVCGGFGADQVDHVVPLAEGGADDDTNLRPIHAEPCHREKTRAEAQRAWTAAHHLPITAPSSTRFPQSLLVLVGAPAVGKTWVAERLAQATSWRYRSIDDCGPRGHHTERWTEMLRWLTTLDRHDVIAECNQLPPELSDRLPAAHWSRVVELTAPTGVREQRLSQRAGSWSSIAYMPSPHATQRLDAASALPPLTTLLNERTSHG